MSEIQKFRKSINGFNKHDVVTYIEYITNKHHSQIIQLNNQLAAAHAALQNIPTTNTTALEEENAALRQQVAQLQEALAAAQNSAPAAPSCTEQELEAYRRAERAERLAMERARQTTAQAQAAVKEASSAMQLTASQLEDAARSIADQLDVYKSTVLNAGNVLTNTANTLGELAKEE